ncbi:ATP-binding cassette domain-containing protein [Turicibacter sanguinis]|uniref:ABC transporter ATP-binding protein n=1 Tax=Turicibacter sanguinis TaxID=154288 RepID=UPI0012BC25FC|nr:ABC transporter ATP-binding protein [Turicibacter sanguinis]MDB8565630.1 ABC transporter ATP-binding protein [Turicibacter sanguinis]MDB8568299.1 ABC transporter ATP-binding protein [Turicibacter sanguinis]MDB8571131.1 ABC transporter ATP-binding protein [Turicibacter sanguinis]MDB8579890.1 ABC transporter ATP-binding protein [Turicibacter sanguinis]MTO08998.1 ATP-binding cassette domain-containing protein [Turicibacter sanguinis]
MLELQNVTKRYGKKTVLDNVSIQFKKGEITCLLGLNGVGKSTTMKAIMRLVPISKGKILVDGEPITQQNINKMAYIPDIPIHDLGWTIPQNLSFAQVFYKNFNLEKAERMLKFFKVPTDKKLKELSKGNLARFNIIVGMCQDAPYLLLDEPFSGIDVFTRKSFINLLKSEFLEDGQTVIITTHEIDEIQDIADHIVLLEEGQVFASFSKEEAQNEGLSIVDKMRTLYSEV